MLEGKIDVNAHLYLWTTNNYLHDALDLIPAIGFEYKTIITWFKGANAWQMDRIGLGQYFRGTTEHCLFAVKGVLPYKTMDGKRAQGLTGFYEPKREHSRKPETLYRYAELVSYPPRLELFARYRREGWDSWGDEVEESASNVVQNLSRWTLINLKY